MRDRRQIGQLDSNATSTSKDLIDYIANDERRERWRDAVS